MPSDTPSRSPRIEAAEWLARLHAEDRTESDIRAFQDWIAADPAHADAFEKVNATWDSAGALPRNLLRDERAARHTRRKVLAGGVTALLAVGAGAALLRPAQAVTYRTAIGERKTVPLPGGSELLLDTDTRVDVSDDRAARLLQGCAEFSLRDNGQSFTLAAMDSTVTARQARFTARCEGTRLSLLVVAGTAQAQTGSGRRVQLNAGDRLVVDGAAIRLDRPDTAPLLAWRTGQAIFRDTRLADAVAEMNRYSRTRLEIETAAARELRLSGTFALGDSAAFAGAVAMLLPVRARASNGRIEIRMDPSRASRG